VSEAAEDALLDYLRDPRRFDASRNTPLQEYLFRAASHDVLNHFESERRREACIRIYGEFLRGRPQTYEPVDGEPPPEHELGIDEFVHNDAERQAARLWLQGERHTRPLADILGLSSLSRSQAQREVKRFKDRLRQGLRRWNRNHQH
jgi:DNA-directed RNA polymerase specialized sigma24 family protein